ncbi:CidA/LrgA family protein [Thalassotalea euphylliae]|uniref:CidA/LrgA family protein n=1 Tax=Thalassotalea euphylliae TaxID=1655234 RepID=UPI00363C7308
MTAVYSLFLIFFCLGLGYATHAFVDIIPPSLYGMFYLAIGLQLELFNAKKMDATVNWIIKHMGVCFVPAGVGIMNYGDLVVTHGISIFLFTVVTTVLLMILVSWSYSRLQTRKKTGVNHD